ncbi:MAG: Flp pilus assembly complex ATPase component TadA [Candidatus Omnitrophica bacterium]|nr:Flp pilus assembly complex ATPase component TadA [Candidatus Omnitrophota bacterium]
MKPLRERIIDKLIEHGFVARAELDSMLAKYTKKNIGLGKILVREGIVSERDFMIFLSQELHIPPLDLSRYRVDPQLSGLLSEAFCKQWLVVPLSHIGQTVTVAMADPCDIIAIDNLQSMLHSIDIVIATEKNILMSIERLYHPDSDLTEKEQGPQDDEILLLDENAELEVAHAGVFDEENIEEAIRESQTPPIVKIVNLILIEALSRRASDIHIEPCENKLKVRYRIDGRLKEAMTLPKENQSAILARVKIMAGVDITESRFPQDGRFGVKFRDGEVDFRVSVFPITFGGKIVLRALDVTNLKIGLDQLGFLDEPCVQFKEAIKKPFGMLLVTGPTGSGKSTTLYSILNQLNTPDRNIITVEDPVEYELEGISQIQVHPDIGLTFAAGLKSILRQSPDIILVGEIRDYETADIAVKAALTGHLLLSTLHTNDAPSAITRLRDMGIESYLIASSLVLVAAQRLMRRICPNCRVAADIDEEILLEEGLSKEEIARGTFFKGMGCTQCNYTGYRGRMGTLEVLVPDDTMRDMILSNASSDEIKEYARSGGFRTLRENAIQKFLSGMTTFEEVLRVTAEEEEG